MSLQEKISNYGKPIELKSVDDTRLTEDEIRYCLKTILWFWRKKNLPELQTVSPIVDGVKIDFIVSSNTSIKAVAFIISENCHFLIRDISTEDNSVIIHFRKPPKLRIANFITSIIVCIFLFIVCFALEYILSGDILAGKWITVNF